MQREDRRFDAWYMTFAALLGFTALFGCDDNEFPCENPEAVTMDGVDQGVDLCAGGFLRRRGPTMCSNEIPRIGFECNASSAANQCIQDTDCSEGSFCTEVAFRQDIGGPSCQCSSIPPESSCSSDAECPSGTGCSCDSNIGQCESMDCRADSDCEDGFSCVSHTQYQCCSPQEYTRYACQTSDDECVVDTDCNTGANEVCQYNEQEGRRTCGQPLCVGFCAGRPFLVDDEFRLASPEMRRDWSSQLHPISDFTEEERALAAEGWTEAGLMEHASIAAFARFAMQLMSLGAPPELIEATTQAMQDETHHAKDCFALASMFAGRPIGPGALPIENALDDGNDLLSIVALTIHEGCIGETVAALEAVEALQYTTDPTIRSVLEQIARDERQHAALAWRFLRWVLATHPQLRADIQTSFQATIDAEIYATQSAQRRLRDQSVVEIRHLGLVDSRRSVSVKLEVLHKIIKPCMHSLFRELPHNISAMETHRI